jgi:hypothetical protein
MTRAHQLMRARRVRLAVALPAADLSRPRATSRVAGSFLHPIRSFAMSLHNAQHPLRAETSARPDTRLTKEAAIAHSPFIPRVMALWDEGLDTFEIANRLSEHEHVVACCVRIGRERRFAASPTAEE